MSADATARLAVPVDSDDHVRGDPLAPLTLVEYGDFECPYCAAAHVVVRQIEHAFSDQLSFVFRHFPLVNIHPHAEMAAEAAESAGSQGDFWPMHDTLFENRDDLSPKALLAYAAASGADAGRVEADLASNTWREKIQRDLLGGARSGVNGTPTFFVNGIRYDGSWEYPSFASYLTRLAAAL